MTYRNTQGISPSSQQRRQYATTANTPSACGDSSTSSRHTCNTHHTNQYEHGEQCEMKAQENYEQKNSKNAIDGFTGDFNCGIQRHNSSSTILIVLITNTIHNRPCAFDTIFYAFAYIFSLQIFLYFLISSLIFFP